MAPMRTWRVLVTLAVILLLSTTLVRSMAVGGCQPDLFLIFVVYLSLAWPLEQSFFPCWLAGLVEDVFSGGGHIGAFAALYLVLALLISRVRQQLFVEHMVTRLIVVGGALVLSHGLWLLIWYHSPGWRWSSALGTLMCRALYTVLVTPPVLGLFWVLGWRR